MWGDSDDQPLRRETVRFVGGPWDGKAARYVDIDDHGDMTTPEGRYRFEDVNERAETIYVFQHGHVVNGP
jgi:hypothetical protein